ncbi:MAG: ChaN family lipoprotein [Nitrospirota bacterium]|nr:ChaN family lipoprotein [Nitrospirota bacterium]MDP2382754.1 ChaN family lipoprotein [Nitrospirota bacterium]MDP3597200.1 ChaN family lipoprotein [Nitrospirota bacterium]
MCQLLLVVGTLWSSVACTSGGGAVSSISSHDNHHTPFQEWQILDTATGQPVSLDQWTLLLLQQEIIYLGEEHHNRFHIDAAITLLRRLQAEGRTPVLAMEMFGWDGQAALDQYLSDSDTTRQEFLEAVRWKQNWGGSYEDYEPLVLLAKAQHWTVRALNPPKALVRSVAQHGLAQAQSDPVMAEWGMKDEAIVDDPVYRARILEQLQACHGGGDDRLYQTMYEASMVRDEAMAKTLVNRLNQIRAGTDSMAGPLVSYTGGGHIQYNLPVPKRVVRRLTGPARQVSVYMTSFEVGRIEELQEMIREKIADYLWLTPVSSQGPPRRCR